MNETGIIIKVEENRALVCIEEIVPTEGGGNGNCVSCGHDNKAKRDIWAKYSKDKKLQISDKVEIYYPPGKTIKAAFLILILPIFLFFLFYYLSGILFKLHNDFLSGLYGLGGIVTGFLINLILYQFNKNSRLPEITRKI